MNRADHQVDVIVDGKRVSVEGEKVELRIDGLAVYEFKNNFVSLMEAPDEKPELFLTSSVMSLLETAKAIFGHPDRYRIVLNLKDTVKSFTEMQKFLNLTPPTLNFHLKKLMTGRVISKSVKNGYVLTFTGQALLEFFAEFLEKAQQVQNTTYDANRSLNNQSKG